MATLELDPYLRKGIKLLHSKSRDSAEQLKALLEETLRQRHGKSLALKDPFTFKRESPIPRAKQGSPINISVGKSEKREISSKSRDDDGHLSKKPKRDSPHSVFKSHTPSPTPSLKSESSSWSRKSDESDSDVEPNPNDLAMEIGINCTVCKSFEQTSGNQLVECQECHSLYHQECHIPVVSHQDVTDPRLVWYCAKCSRNLKKQSSVVSSASGGTQSLGGIRSASSSSSTKSSMLASSRAGPSPSKGSNLQRPSPFANLSSVSKNSGNSSSNSSSSSGTSSIHSGSSSSSSGMSSRSGGSSSSRNASAPPNANSIMNAERRMHLMKKKAAAKIAERRKI